MEPKQEKRLSLKYTCPTYLVTEEEMSKARTGWAKKVTPLVHILHCTRGITFLAHPGKFIRQTTRPIYTVSYKNGATTLKRITSLVLSDFTIGSKFALKKSTKSSPYLKHVATLPC